MDLNYIEQKLSPRSCVASALARAELALEQHLQPGSLSVKTVLREQRGFGEVLQEGKGLGKALVTLEKVGVEVN